MGAGTIRQGGFGPASLGVSLLGAFNLLALVKLVQQGIARQAGDGPRAGRCLSKQ